VGYRQIYVFSSGLEERFYFSDNASTGNNIINNDGILSLDVTTTS